MTEPLITIGITAYKAADTIRRAIASAAAQDWPRSEIIIVDDCSGDQTVTAIEEAIKGIEHVRLIVHKENTGPAGARNTILRAANGEFVAFFDDDDESLPERLKTQHARIVSYERETGSDIVLCYASGERLYPNGYKKPLDAIGSQGHPPYGEEMADRLLFFGGDKSKFYGAGTPTCSLMARKRVFEQVGGFDQNFRRVEDIDFAVRCAIAGGHFIGCPQRLFVQHATDASDKSYENNLEAELQLVEKHQAFLKKRGRYVYAREWPKIRYSHFKKDYGRFFMILAKLWCRHPIAVTKHLFTTGPARLVHERKMRKTANQETTGTIETS